METVETKMATISLRDNNRLFFVMKENEEVDLDATKEHYEITMRLTKGNRYVSLVDARPYVTITDEAKKYAARPDMYTHAIAQAVVINSLATRLLANFLIRFTQKYKHVEMRIFNDYDDAQNWLDKKLTEEKMMAKAI